MPHTDQRRLHRLNIIAGATSVSIAALLVALKLAALLATGSLAIAASLTDSAIDLVVSVAGLFAIRYAARPPDLDHTFGHSSAEDLMALGQAAVVGASGVLIGWTAIERLSGPEVPLQSEGLGLVVMIISIFLTLGLLGLQRWVVRQTGSKVVEADSLHYISDLLPNIGAIIALVASVQFGLPGIDAIIALVAAVAILIGAARLGHRAWDALMDHGVDPEITHRIEVLVENWPGVRGFHDLKTRVAGSKIFIQLDIELDGDQTLAEAHDIGASLRRAIRTEIPNSEVLIHKDVAGRAREA